MPRDGLKSKYLITKADGTPATGRYFVLKVDSKDPEHAAACRRALVTYAHEIRHALPDLAMDLVGAMLEHGRTGSWKKWDECVHPDSSTQEEK